MNKGTHLHSKNSNDPKRTDRQIVGDLNKPLSLIDRLSRQKIDKLQSYSTH
jgi:hypothetical protein